MHIAVQRLIEKHRFWGFVALFKIAVNIENINIKV